MAKSNRSSRNWRFQDLTGRVFEHWTVIREGETQNRHVHWLCRCICGNEREIASQSLLQGRSTSCGCQMNKTFDSVAGTITCTGCSKPFPATTEFFHSSGKFGTGLDPCCKRCKAIKHQELRIEVLTHYSGGTPRCACCGVEHLIFLCIDHKNGDGNIHRKEVASSLLFSWLKRNNFPEEFQVLCFNCNMAISIQGWCVCHPEIVRPVNRRGNPPFTTPVCKKRKRDKQE